MMGLLERELRRRHDYIRELEEERRKIEAFRRELPLCLQLVTQKIESVRQRMGCRDDDERETRAIVSPVLEEFIPLKPTSPEEQRSQAAEKKTAPDWLRSAQLWNQQLDGALEAKMPKKPVAVNLGKLGGAFQPFERESKAATSASTGRYDCSGSGRNEEKETRPPPEPRPPPNRKGRRCWSPELHRRFLNALHLLGGSHVATPKQIRELMKVDGLTNDEVKSHLQKYRLHTRRPGPPVRSSGCSLPPQYILVGGILVPPPVPSSATAVMRLQQQKETRSGNAGNGDAAKSASFQTNACSSSL